MGGYMSMEKEVAIESFLQIHNLDPQFDIMEVASSVKGANHSIANTILPIHLTKGVLLKP